MEQGGSRGNLPPIQGKVNTKPPLGSGIEASFVSEIQPCQ